MTFFIAATSAYISANAPINSVVAVADNITIIAIAVTIFPTIICANIVIVVNTATPAVSSIVSASARNVANISITSTKYAVSAGATVTIAASGVTVAFFLYCEYSSYCCSYLNFKIPESYFY